MRPAVIAAAVARGLAVVPGILTPTEAFTALSAGATALKAMLTVLPNATRLIPVGGIEASAMSSWWRSGATGFGLGGTLFRPGMALDEIADRAGALISTARELSR